jgi:hypothetical protein
MAAAKNELADIRARLKEIDTERIKHFNDNKRSYLAIHALIYGHDKSLWRGIFGNKTALSCKLVVNRALTGVRWPGDSQDLTLNALWEWLAFEVAIGMDVVDDLYNMAALAARETGQGMPEEDRCWVDARAWTYVPATVDVERAANAYAEMIVATNKHNAGAFESLTDALSLALADIVVGSGRSVKSANKQ